MLFIYTLLFYLLIPILLLRLYWRGFKVPTYRKRWGERFAIYSKEYPTQVIWIHAVSVGETVAVFPLIKQLQQRYPANTILITTTTITGSARVKAMLGNTVSHVYLPYDLPMLNKSFLNTFKPKISIFMEKEIWPNLYAQCALNKIPLIIINARLSVNSAKNYKKISTLITPTLTKINWIVAQTKADKQRFITIGANRKSINVIGNLKFDLAIDESVIKQAKALKTQLFKNRFVWVVASTHKPEEEIFFHSYTILKQQIPDLLLILAPRHPERFYEVKKLAIKMQLQPCVHSFKQTCVTDTDVYLVDTIGELQLFYGVADICFVGGSMVPVGGHNILEPAAMNVPIMFGRYMTNFMEIAKKILALEAAVQCLNQEELIKTVLLLHNDAVLRASMAEKAYKFVKNNQGSTAKVTEIIAGFLSAN